MGTATKFILIALLTFTLRAGAQTAAAPLSRELAGTSPATGTVNPAPQSAVVRILTPVASQKLATNSTTVLFELTNPAAVAGTPNYLVQMDGRTPVHTSLTQQVFTGLAPGAHTVTVKLVDANGTPIQGGRAAVQFFVPTATAQPAITAPKGVAASGAQHRELKITGFKFQQPDPTKADDSNLPPASSPLPLISIIGFGVLVGGIVSAMKTRS